MEPAVTKTTVSGQDLLLLLPPPTPRAEGQQWQLVRGEGKPERQGQATGPLPDNSTSWKEVSILGESLL